MHDKFWNWPKDIKHFCDGKLSVSKDGHDYVFFSHENNLWITCRTADCKEIKDEEYWEYGKWNEEKHENLQTQQ